MSDIYSLFGLFMYWMLLFVHFCFGDILFCFNCMGEKSIFVYDCIGGKLLMEFICLWCGPSLFSWLFFSFWWTGVHIQVFWVGLDHALYQVLKGPSLNSFCLIWINRNAKTQKPLIFFLNDLTCLDWSTKNISFSESRIEDSNKCYVHELVRRYSVDHLKILSEPLHLESWTLYLMYF